MEERLLRKPLGKTPTRLKDHIENTLGRSSKGSNFIMAIVFFLFCDLISFSSLSLKSSVWSEALNIAACIGQLLDCGNNAINPDNRRFGEHNLY